MQTIIPVSSTHRITMGTQKIDHEKKYKWITCCSKLPMEGGTLFFNYFTKELILIDHEEQETAKTNTDFWISHWFMIPEDSDERQLYIQFKGLLKLLQKPNNKRAYTILTTTACNARCHYCYEAGRKKSSMTLACADEIVQYINKTKTSEKVNLLWFGGEPLFRSEVIDRICNGLKEKNILFQSSMTSNGYLFDEKMIQRAKELWNLSAVQITLDGTENAYNSIKSYIYKDTSAFQVVLENIEQLLLAGVRVKIRLNMGLDNFEDLYSLCSFLKDKFQNNQNIVVYPMMLYEDSQKASYTDRIRTELREKYFALQNLIDDLGIGSVDTIKHGYKIDHCQADNDRAICISPEGNLTECQHFSDTEIVGTVTAGMQDSLLVKEWKEFLPEQEECSICKFYVDCIKLKKCPVVNRCTEHDRLIAEYQTNRKIRNAYAKYQKEQNYVENRNLEE